MLEAILTVFPLRNKVLGSLNYKKDSKDPDGGKGHDEIVDNNK